jgi:molybdopterin-guanine dinucleotide biosynthesis protein A
MMTRSTHSAAILAGGSNLRFDGHMKPLARFRGQAILERQLEVLEPLFDEILLITNTPDLFSSYTSVRILTDRLPGHGPLSGIHTALSKASGNSVFVVAGDMPFINTTTIRDQLQLAREHPQKAIVPQTGRQIQPLHSIYPVTTHSSLQQHLQSAHELSVRKWIQKISAYYWKTKDSNPFININTPEELRKYEKG